MFAASKTDSASTGGYQISRSLRFNSADSAYLNRTPASAGNRKTWTWSGWVKRSTLNTYQYLFSAGTSSPWFGLLFSSNGTNNLLQVTFTAGASGGTNTTAEFRDPSAWYHIVLAVDTTQATDTNRFKLYVNGVQITAFSATNYPAQNTDTQVNSADRHTIGSQSRTLGEYLDGYQTEVNFIDGTQLTPSSFGETNAQTGVWQPKAYSGSYGTNGFYLNFSDNSNTTAATLGKDYSGNGNNWTPNNFSVTAGSGNDSLVDTPTPYGVDTGAGGTVRGNYATINPLQLISNVSVSNGNLYLQSNNNQDVWASAPSTIAVRTGKWYAEFTCVTVGGTPNFAFGVGRASWSPIILDGQGYYGRWWYTTEGYSYLSNGNFYTGNASIGTAATFANGDIIGVAMDLDAGSIAFYKNGTLQGTPFTSIPLGVDYIFAGGAFTFSYPTPTNVGAYYANYGQRPFAYTAPSGFKALCTQNLPTPTIGATTATQAGKFFAPTLYTGNGASPRAVTGVGFQPDLVWMKCRSSAFVNGLFDSVRGTGKLLISNLTVAEIANDPDGYLSSFDSDGFSLTTGSSSNNTFNGNTSTYVAWGWKANGSGSTNTSGSITSTVSANTTSGFSVVTYTGTGSNATVGHGLGVAPSMIIFKRRNSATDWPVYHVSLGATNLIYLDLTNASGASSDFQNTAPTSTVFSIAGGSANIGASGGTFLAYCFAEVAGYSKFGSYTGNGSADGPFIFTGMRPAYLVLKSSAGVVQTWIVEDSKRFPSNVVSGELYPSDSGAESSGQTRLDLVSNGFKIRTTDTAFNQSGCTYIYMAFAENPFKFSLAR
jgi:hypothetical protein